MKCKYCNRSILDEDYCKGCGAPVVLDIPNPSPNPLRDIPDATWDSIKDSLDGYFFHEDTSFELVEGNYLDVRSQISAKAVWNGLVSQEEKSMFEPSLPLIFDADSDESISKLLSDSHEFAGNVAPIIILGIVILTIFLLYVLG